ncbi:hypothetical protein HUT19_30105 [Streptomyces sp. NA02950]|uniref:hypothetical protein n=1 Tax=Streptomyces sp. NA02950 TaxID=2742137 RepID=UPI0015918476|nr:hypothetical protein [Streptomyces sp. NA02950]QKV95463.1 hypothetical protein HUT19_30105 [Streptomyces sp. NA02950]
MGWTVLYIAFGVVALWLLGEVLLQYKARLRWRLLAFVGFLGVVAGVLVPSVLVIGIGAVAFAIGQTYVTLSFRRGFEAGWALRGGLPGLGGGRDEERAGPPEPEAEPILEVSELEAVPSAPAEPPMYRPEPMPDDTGEYGVYDDSSPFMPSAPAGASAYGGGADGGYSAYETYGGYGSQDNSQGHGYAYGQDVYADAGQAGQQGQYDYGNEAYAAYGDPYGGAQPQPQPQPQADPYAQQQPYGQQQYPDPYAAYGQQDPYAADPLGGDHWAAAGSYPEQAQYAPGGDAMQPGGTWVPQQRDGEARPPADQPYPYPQQGFQQGYDEQYRY